jgi:hypothetical protein
MATRPVTGIFDRFEDAAQAVRDLEAAGIPARDISLVANNVDGSQKSVATTDAGPGAGTGAAVGGVAGGAAGVLAGLGMLAIPGVGPVVAAGWLVATAVGAVAGGAAGAAIGGIAGTFVAAGIDQEDADFYAETIRRGGSVVTAKPDDEHRAAAEQILSRRAVNAIERRKLYQDAGWKSFDPAAPAFTQAEIEAERRRYNSGV